MAKKKRGSNMKFATIRDYSWLILVSMLCLVSGAAAERDTEAAKAAAQGHSPDLEEAVAPRKLVDLTEGERIPPPRKGDNPTWNMGPTGIIGIKNGGNKGDQIRIISVMQGSPADGRVLPGDVLLGVQGRKFKVGGDINWLAGNAIIDAETEAGKGVLEINIWRDRNWTKRTGSEDVFGIDIDQMFKAAEGASNDIYEWEDTEGKVQAVKEMEYEKYPIDGIYTNITLQLEVIGTYSDSSPWDCPVVSKVRENAWKVLAAKFKPDQRGRRRGSWPGVLALVASGKPEYIKLAKDWVHSQKKLCQDINAKVSLADMGYRGYQSWHHGFNWLEMAIYYDATGDDFVLPEIRKHAILAALGQNGGGSWGHTFAFREFNGGMLHRNNPGYGAMNNAGGRCFFLLTLAKKAGIEHPEIDAAIGRANRFFSTFVDKGCIPYGYHSPWPSDDSNGKNYGPAYAFYTLGQKYKAKFFSMHSAHASFSRRGGHGSPTLWYYTPLSAHMSGPDAIKAYQRNMRYFYTLSRRHDGSFVFQGEQEPGIGGKGMRNPTATVALHMSYPLRQLIITGKDADPSFRMTDEELKELLVSARAQIKDPVLLERIGKPLNERASDELIDLLDHFFPNRRRGIASELGKRYAAGENDILSKVMPLLSSDEARMRDGACLALSECGKDAVLANMSKVVAMLKDDAEFVRMTAAKVIGKATEPGDKTREVAVLKAVVDDHPQMTMDNGNVKNAAKSVLLPRKKRGGGEGPSTLLTTSPFRAGYDEGLVRMALERIVTMDPQGTVPNTWDRETLIKLAGPVTFAAEELQVNDAMFGGARKSEAQSLLRKHGYKEAVEGNASNLRKRSLLERSLRVGTTFKDSYITPKVVKETPGQFKPYLDDLNLWQLDNPTHTFSEKTGKDRPPITTPLNLLIEIIEKSDVSNMLPGIWPDVQEMFKSELARAGGSQAQLQLCRAELKDLDRKNIFRKMAAMSHLAKELGVNAIDEISPFLGHERWRINKHANDLAVELVGQGAGDRLVQLFHEAQARESGIKGNWNAAGILAALSDADYKPALHAAKGVLKHRDPLLRGAAVQAVFDIGGDPELKTVFAFIRSVAEEREDFHGAEQALLSKKDDPEHVTRVSAAATTLLPRSGPKLRRSLAWVMGQFGGAGNLAAIEKAAAASKDSRDVIELVRALAYSPDRDATESMTRLVDAGALQRNAVALLGVHRMVGRHGWDEVSNKERVRFGRKVLNLKYDAKLIFFFGRVHTAGSMKLLYDVMKKGGGIGRYQNSTEIAAKGIVNCAEGIEKPSKAESELAAEVLTELIEYIEVTHLRGGYKAQVKDFKEAAGYAAWQGLQARAGQALLKFHKPSTRVIPQFEDVDLDI